MHSISNADHYHYLELAFAQRNGWIDNSVFNPHLNDKKLLKNSSLDFVGGLDTIETN